MRSRSRSNRVSLKLRVILSLNVLIEGHTVLILEMPNRKKKGGSDFRLFLLLSWPIDDDVAARNVPQNLPSQNESQFETMAQADRRIEIFRQGDTLGNAQAVRFGFADKTRWRDDVGK